MLNVELYQHFHDGKESLKGNPSSEQPVTANTKQDIQGSQANTTQHRRIISPGAYTNVRLEAQSLKYH